jgi:hypothetical protein
MPILLQSQICGPILGIHYINRSQINECWNWERSHAIPVLGIHKLNFRYSVDQEQEKTTTFLVYDLAPSRTPPPPPTGDPYLYKERRKT